jgi:hypothetical protein
MQDFHALEYDATKHKNLIEEYMSTTDIKNNKTPKAFRLSEYDRINGTLFIVLDPSNKIRAVSSVVLEEGLNGKCAKIYGRFHIDLGVSHTVIDRFFEPMTFDWCAKRQVRQLFFTINEGNHKVLDWSARRVGERRNSFRGNKYHQGIGSEIRAGLVPYGKLIFERYCWQYAIYYSPDGKWFLDRPVKDLDDRARVILMREFPNGTQNWD